MVRSYRKYEALSSFGTICTASSNIVWTPDGSSRKTGVGRAYVGANEDVLCWSVKIGDLVSRWRDKDNRAAVTCIAQCAVQPDLVAVGYQDGSIRIWDALSGLVIVTFNGHKSAITNLQFDREGSRLASGSRDTDIIVWNLLSETAEFRLRGHRDQITGLSFLRTRTLRRQSPHTDEGVDVTSSDGEAEVEERHLLSTSKDALIKIWDLLTPHCIETHVAQSAGECWALALSPDGTGCVTAGNDGEMKVWSIDLETLSDLGSNVVESNKQECLKSQGVLRRASRERAQGISFHPKGSYFAVHSSEKAVEIWRIRNAEETQRRLRRKRQRRREKVAATDDNIQLESQDELGVPDVTDVFGEKPYCILRTGGKVRSVDWTTTRGSKNMQLLTATTNNQLELYAIAPLNVSKKVPEQGPDPEYSRVIFLDLPGHRTDIRALSLSSDDRMLASASAGALKVWNLKTQSCLRTLECGVALCSAFLPGDKIVLIGTKSGALEMYDIATSSLIEKFQAHDGAIWTLAVHPDGRSVVTGSADKCAKFWRFDIIDEEIPGTRRMTQRLKLAQTKVLKVADDVLSLCFSPDRRLLALSTLDNTVKVFFVDSLKLFLTLYGHKLPVLNLSISSDSKLIATCSADKNVRIWGLDFGDCHKAFFAHQDSVMQVSFIQHPVEADEKHLLFSASKDGMVKSWDGDKFEQIQALQGHHGEIWAMAVSRTGETVVTASHDKSIRVWEVGDDLIFLEEERERELEEMYESTLAQNMDKDFRDEEEQGAEVAVASKQTIATLTHGEKVMEALELSISDLHLMREWEQRRQTSRTLAPPQRNPLFLVLGNISAEDHVLRTLQKIPMPALNDALYVLPFSTLPTLFTFLALFLQQHKAPELSWRVFYFLLQAHMQQILASGQLRGVLGEILDAYERWQHEERGVIGFNMAGLGIMSREAREVEGSSYLSEPDEEEVWDRGKKKRAFASIA